MRIFEIIIFVKYVIFRAQVLLSSIEKKMSKNLFAIAKVHQKVLQSPFLYTGRIALVGKRQTTNLLRQQICRRQILNGNKVLAKKCHFFAYKSTFFDEKKGAKGTVHQEILSKMLI